MHRRLAILLRAGCLTALCASSLGLAAPFTAGNLAVYRVGTGSGTLSNAAAAVFIDEYTPTGTLVQSIAMPTADAGAQKALVATGNAGTEGQLSLSSDGQCLWVPGYAAAVGTTSLPSTTAASTPRTVGRLTGDGSVDTSTSLNDFFNTGNIRSVGSDSCAAAWVTGSNSGIGHVTFGASAITSVVSTTLTNLRAVGVFGGQLYASNASGSNPRVGSVGSGLPATAGQTISGLPGMATSGNANAYFFADLSASVPGVDTLYVAYDDAPALSKYSLVGGTWVSNGVVGVASDAYRGLTGVVNGGSVTLYATRKGGTGSTGGGELVSIADSSGYNAANNGTPTLLATAATNTAFRGVALAPAGNPSGLPNVTLTLSTTTASEAAQTVVTLTATASATLTSNETVNVAVSGFGITAADYTLSSTTITIPTGATTGTATFTVVDDGVAEGPETATIALTGPSAGIVLGSPSSRTLPIADSSPPTTIITRIHSVQGSGAASPLAGQSRTVEGIVTANFQAAGSLGGFFIQEEDANVDADPATSEGIFIYNSATPVAAGDKVQVTGTVIEFGTAPNTLTEISPATVTILSSGNPLPSPAIVSLPVSAVSDLERYEGMRVQFAQTLTVTEHFNLARYGELMLSVNGRLPQPTNIVDPNDSPASGTSSSGTSNVAAVTAQANLNLRSSILLADTSSTQNPAVIPFFDPVTNTIRSGTTVDALSGILTHSFGNYAVHVTTNPAFNYAPRPLTPPVVGGAIKAASFNVLNFFNGNGAGGGFPTSRGADTALEFSRQKAKIVAALCGLGADVVGLMEMENDGNSATSALTELTNALSGTANCGNWTYVPNPAGWGTIPGSTDEIRPALIYRTTAVAPVGASMAPNNAAFNQARAPVAQTFSAIGGPSAGAKLSVIVNHFKSKGGTGTGADADQGDGQGNWNNARKGQATALLSFITAVQAAANDLDVLVLGDLNAYSEEDPIDILRAGGLVKLGNEPYSYVFDGQFGSLDHALATPSLAAQVTKADVWHINSDEPTIIDYNVEFKNHPNCPSATCTSPDYYTATPFRSSDHDPVLIGMALDAPSLDIDDSAPATQYDAATDGLLLLRYLFGYRDAALTADAIGAGARRDAAQIAQHIVDTLSRFDVDGDGQTLALTDGVMILRRLLGINGTAITLGVKNSNRSDADVVLAIDALKP